MDKSDSLNFSIMKFLTVPAHSPSYFYTRWVNFQTIVEFFNEFAKDKIDFDFEEEYEIKLANSAEKYRMKEIIYYAAFRTERATVDQYELKKKCILFLYDMDPVLGKIMLGICNSLGVNPINIVPQGTVPDIKGGGEE